MTTGLIDCHAHLAHFDLEIDELEKSLKKEGIDLLLSSGMDLESSKAALDLAAKSPMVLGSVGLHPWHVTEDWKTEVDLAAFSVLAADPNCVAISEVGVDNWAVHVPLEHQLEALTWFINLAQRKALPMVLHLQAPVEVLLEVWSSIKGTPPAAAIHGFAGTTRDAELLLAEGFLLSLGTVTTGQMVAGKPVDDDVIQCVPDDRLLLDSDAYVPSELLRTVANLDQDLQQWLGAAQPLEAGSLRQVADYVAGVRGVSVDTLAQIVRSNFEKFISRREPA